MGASPLVYANTPGLIAQPQSALAAGTPLTSLPLSIIQSDADFANVKIETFYQTVQDGESIDMSEVVSYTDGYQYQESELILHWERISTVSNVGGLPAAAGGLLEIADWIDPASSAEISTPYMVQGAATTDTNGGIMGVWILGIRGRGLNTIPSGLSFTYQADSVFANGNALTQAVLQALSASAQQAAVACEVFTDAGQGTNWTPNWTPAVNAYGKPSWGKANGCYYQALEVTGPTAAVEPDEWPTKLGSVLIDGGVLWVLVGRGFSNGQQFSMPTSPTDGHVYTAAEMKACLTSWITTGQANLTGPSGSGRIQRLQKSAPGGLVSTTVTYWDGNNQTVTHDGVVHCVGIFQRALPAYAAVPPAYNVFEGNEFMSGNPLCTIQSGQTSNDLQRLAQNVMNAAVRPEGFPNPAIGNGSAATLPTSHSGYAYNRSECMNVWELTDTGAETGDMAIRLWVMSVDGGSGLVSCRVDYNQGGNQITTANGSLNIVLMAARASNVVLSGVITIGTQGSPTPVPQGENGVLNGSFETWVGLIHAGAQFVGVPTLWSVSNNTADGYTTQQPGIDSAYGVGLNVGNAHGAANTQWVSLLSYPIAVTAGDLYAYSLLAFAEKAGSPGTGITTGFIVRCHIRDINFANDVSFDLIPNQGLGYTPTKFSGSFTMPVAGATTVLTKTGQVISLTGAVPAQPTYFYYEIWNYKPNVTSMVEVDDMQLIDIASGTDNVSPVNSAQSLSTNASLSQSGTSTTINVSANSLITPYQTVSYGAGSVNPGSYGTWYIYALDPQLAGGAVTYLATQNEASLTSMPGCVRFGAITTTPAGGGSGGGTGGSGGTTTLTITTYNPNPATPGIGYSYQLQAYGGTTPYTWSLASGSLPSGLGLSSSGLISGTTSSAGNYAFTAKVVDSSSPQQVATQPMTIYVS
jgi:hypothetical protein